MLKATNQELDDAVAAALSIRERARSLSGRSSVNTSDLVRFANRTQEDFEQIAPLLRRSATEVQAAARAHYGNRAPTDVHGLVSEARTKGQAVIATIVSIYEPQTVAAHVFDQEAGLYRDRAFGATDLAPLNVPLAELIEALSAVAD